MFRFNTATSSSPSARGFGYRLAAFVFYFFKSLFEFLCLRFETGARFFEFLPFTRCAIAFLADVIQ